VSLSTAAAVLPSRRGPRRATQNLHLKPIPQQVVVVVGASSGIGRATALRFAEQGAAVVVAAANPACAH
jgi:NADPH:quinone reductase-like Zn-dependent oxidoreductase